MLDDRRNPLYLDDDSDFSTNAESYYKDLARKQKLLKILSQKIIDYDKKLDASLLNIQTILDNYIAILDGKFATFDEKVMLLLREWIDDGTFAEIINTEIFKSKADTTFVDIRRYHNDLYEALQNEEAVQIPEGVFTSRPIPKELLIGKSVVGMGKHSIVKFTGDVIAFDLDGVQNNLLRDFKILVDPINSKDIIRISGITAEAMRNEVSNIYTDTIDDSEGVYTACRVLSNNKGVYQNKVSNINAENCKNGVLVEARGGDGWATHNLIEIPYVRKYSGIAIGFIEEANSSVINNTFSNPRMLDFTMQDIVRTALKMDGRYNTVTNVQMFNDGEYGTCVAIDFKDIHINYNNTVTGSMEGIIVNEHMMGTNNVDINLVKRKNSRSMSYGSKPVAYYKTSALNLLHNSDFRKGKGLWYGVNADIEVIGGIKTKNRLKITKRGSNSKIQIDLPQSQRYKNSFVTFSASINSQSPLRIVIDDENDQTTGSTFEYGTPINKVNTNELLSVSRKITGDVVHLMVVFEDDIPDGASFIINWVCLTEGLYSPLTKTPELLNYVTKNKGTATIPTGEYFLAIQHGLEVIPNLSDIQISPTSDLGTDYRFWIDYASEFQFFIYVNKPLVTPVSFVWKVEV